MACVMFLETTLKSLFSNYSELKYIRVEISTEKEKDVLGF